MRLKLIPLLLLFMPALLSAQTVADWFKHPSLAAAAQIAEIYNVQSGEFKTRPLTMLKAGFGTKEDPFQVNLIFDIPSARFLTLEAIWQPLPQIGIHAGLQKMLFLYDTTFAPYMYGLMGYSQAASYLAGYSNALSGINSRSRDVGIVLEGSFFPAGKFSELSYAVGVFNGNGYHFKDDNHGKDVHIRLVYQPTASLKFSLGAMNGYYDPSLDHLDPYKHPDHHRHFKEGLACRRRLSAGVWYDDGKWFARSEDIFGITAGVNSNGIMALAGYKFLTKYQLAARVDHFKISLDDPNSAITKTDLCFTRHITTDGTLYVAFQYGHTFYSDPNVKGTDTFMVCLNIAFMRNL